MEIKPEIYKLFLDNSSDWQMICDTDKNILYVSKAFTEISGYACQELIDNKDLLQLIIHVDFRDFYNENHLDEFLNSFNTHKIEFKIVTKNKEEKWIQHYCKPFTDENGKLIGRIVNNRDITHEKKVQLELIEQERRFQTLINNVQGFAYRCKNDKDWTMEYISGKCEQITGYYPNELVGNNLLAFNDLIHEKYHDYLWNKWQKVLKTKDIFTDEYEIITKSGEVRWVWEQGCGIYNEKNEVIAIEGFIMEITDKKIAEKVVRESEQKYKILADLTMDSASVAKIYPNGIIEREWLNDSLLKEYGLAPEDIDTLPKWASYILDEDKQKFIEASQKMMGGGNISIEFRLNTPKLGIRWIRNTVISAIDKGEGCLKVYSAVNDITNSKETERIILEINQELKSSEKKFRDVTESIASAVFIYQNDYFVYVNKGFEEISGYSYDEAIRLNFWDFVHPDYKQMIMDRGRRRLKGEDIPNRYEFKIIRKDGEERWIDFTAGKIEFNGSIAALGTAFDITEKKYSEEKIRKLSRAVEQSSVSIVITDPDGKIEYINPKFEQVTGYTLDEVIGENPRILKSGHANEKLYKELWTTISSGKEWRGELYNKKKDGSFYWENVIISPIINNTGIITHYVSIKEDITDLKNLMNELIISKEKAEESERLKSAFLANMSHEIRTPMNAIMGFAELLSYDDISKSEKKEFSEIINKRSNDLLRIIDDILDISKIEAGVMKIYKTSGNINEVLDEVFQIYKYQNNNLINDNVEIRLSKKLEHQSSHVIADFSRIKQVVTNLINNSLKFTNKGFVEFGVELKNDNILFFVKDTGAGIEKEKQNFIFQRFSQVHENKAFAMKGTGLGLSICKGLVNIMNGKIWFESVVGKGTSFYFTIPYIISNITDTNITKIDNNLESIEILVVEDDEANNKLLTYILNSFKAIVYSSQSGKDALEKIRINPLIKIVLLDIGLPDINGYELAKEIKTLNNNTKIIVQTAFADEESKINFENSVCDFFITKPIIKDVLVSKIKELL